MWTGFTWSELLEDKKKVKILKYIDVLTDGRFEQDKKNVNLLYKGSTNQIEIDVSKSLKKGKIVKYEWKNN